MAVAVGDDGLRSAGQFAVVPVKQLSGRPASEPVPALSVLRQRASRRIRSSSGRHPRRWSRSGRRARLPGLAQSARLPQLPVLLPPHSARSPPLQQTRPAFRRPSALRSPPFRSARPIPVRRRSGHLSQLSLLPLAQRRNARHLRTGNLKPETSKCNPRTAASTSARRDGTERDGRLL